MKIYATIVTLFLIVGCAHHSNNSSAVDIDGTWRGKKDFGMRIGKPGETPRYVDTYFTFNFKREGDTVKGTISSMPIPGRFVPLDDITISGKMITFSYTYMLGPKEVKTSCRGQIKGEKIKLVYISKDTNPEMPVRMRRRNAVKKTRASNLTGTIISGNNATPFTEITIERISKIPEGPVNQ